MYALVTAIGWIGAFTCVAAYGLVSRGTWSVSSRRFQVANVASALMMGLVAARGHVWASVAANAVWAVIGARTVATLMRARRESAAAASDQVDQGVTVDLHDVATIEPAPADVAGRAGAGVAASAGAGGDVHTLELSGLRAGSVSLVA